MWLWGFFAASVVDVVGMLMLLGGVFGVSTRFWAFSWTVGGGGLECLGCGVFLVPLWGLSWAAQWPSWVFPSLSCGCSWADGAGRMPLARFRGALGDFLGRGAASERYGDGRQVRVASGKDISRAFRVRLLTVGRSFAARRRPPRDSKRAPRAVPRRPEEAKIVDVRPFSTPRRRGSHACWV